MHPKSAKIISYIYGLRVKGRKRFFYVGSTNNLKRRLKEHQSKCKFVVIEIKRLQTCKGNLQRLQGERAWCIKLRKKGHPVQSYHFKRDTGVDLWA